MRTPRLLVAVLFTAAGVSACGKQAAYGDANSIVVATRPDLWKEVQDSVYRALEPTIWTVRTEKAFTVTYQDPQEPEWVNLRRFAQLLLIGRIGDPWIDAALAVTDESPPAAPAVIQAYDVWARGQLVTLLLLPESEPALAVTSSLEELHDLYDRQFRQWVHSRMFVSGPDSALADTLWSQAGFRLLVPDVYYWDRQDSVFLFRNDNPDPSELIRQVMVTWVSPVPRSVEPQDLLAWRAEVARDRYSYPQVVDLTNARAGPLELAGHESYQIQAVWQNPPEANWPAGGPFILRAVRCPEQGRLYLLDAWLYAPGREKYEYMIQLETILDSFGCRSEASRPG